HWPRLHQGEPIEFGGGHFLRGTAGAQYPTACLGNFFLVAKDVLVVFRAVVSERRPPNDHETAALDLAVEPRVLLDMTVQIEHLVRAGVKVRIVKVGVTDAKPNELGFEIVRRSAVIRGKRTAPGRKD